MEETKGLSYDYKNKGTHTMGKKYAGGIKD